MPKKASTKYGLPVEKPAPTTTTTAIVPSKWESLKPVSDEVTVYGAKKFRTPTYAKSFAGTKGSPILAGVLDIDGTLQGYGSSADKGVLDWMAKLQKKWPDMVWLVVTARDHEFMYDTSFNWVCAHLPYPFIGPFCRAKDDPRYASEFKRELAQGFEDMGLYQIVAAADDNNFVNDMWKQWAIDHFENPDDFSLLECSHRGDYGAWREHARDGFKKPTYPAYTSFSSATPSYADAKNRPAGTPTQSKYGVDPVDATYKARVDWIVQPEPGDNIEDDSAWAVYFGRREVAGAYLCEPEIEYEEYATAGYSLTRRDMEDIVAHQDPLLTPEDIAHIPDADLRELAGITAEDHRDSLYQDIDDRFGGRYHEGELDPLALCEVEKVLTMTQEEADAFLDAKFYDVDLSDTATPAERQARIDARLDLEDEVYAQTDFTKHEIREMDVEVLRQKLDEAVGAITVDFTELPPSGADSKEGVA